MSAHVPALPLEADPLIAEAKQRARRRRLFAAGVVLALGAVVGGVLASGSGSAGSSGEVPWLPTRPQLGPANPPLSPACTASQLRANLSLQGATGNLAGGISIVNRSSRACSLVGRPRLSFGAWRVTPWHQAAANPRDPLAPPMGSLRALAPGRHVSVSLWWQGICAGASHSDNAPRGVVLTAPGGGRIRLKGPGFPYCNVPSASSVQATRYLPYVPQGPPSSALPLEARIVSGGPVSVKGKTLTQPSFAARPGSWLSYTVVLTNRSRRPFRFGRTCPAYTEGFTRLQAYVLNCHPVGSIAPGRSVRFAMRIRVPNLALSAPAFGWTLAPHSYNAPAALAVVELR